MSYHSIKISTAIFLSAVLFLSCATLYRVPCPDTAQMRQTVNELCSPMYEGRLAGHTGDSLLASLLAHKLSALGFEPFFENGPLQPFSVKSIHSYNTVMIYRSRNANRTLLIGAHYDHLGTGGKGSGSLRPDTLAIHFGADDNASGVALAIETARLLTLRACSRPDLFKANIIVAAFGAEEAGTLGSKKLVDTLAALAQLPDLMINLDMTGRLKDSVLQVSGTGTFSQADSLLASARTEHFPLKLKTSLSGYGPSDHAVFYTQKVPVLFFTTGPHADYHTPFDTPDKLNYPGMVDIAAYVTGVAAGFAEGNFIPVCLETEVPDMGTPKAAFKASLGVIPDFTYEGKGFCAGTVITGRPSQRAGMKNGDVVIAIDNTPIKNIEDYMKKLATLEKGMTITIVVQRESQNYTLEVTL